MTIDNLFKYLEKNNITFNKVTYKWDYFESAPKMPFDEYSNYIEGRILARNEID